MENIYETRFHLNHSNDKKKKKKTRKKEKGEQQKYSVLLNIYIIRGGKSEPRRPKGEKVVGSKIKVAAVAQAGHQARQQRDRYTFHVESFEEALPMFFHRRGVDLSSKMMHSER